MREAGQSLVRALARGVGVGASGNAPGPDTATRARADAAAVAQGLALEEMARGVFCESLGTKTGPNALVQPYQVTDLISNVVLID